MPLLRDYQRPTQRVLFMRQVDDCAIAAPDAKTSDILMDMIDNRLKIPIKRQGYLVLNLRTTLRSM